MHTWQLQEAKAKLSELIRLCATEGPQLVTVHHRDEAVVLSKRDYDFLTSSSLSFLELINKSPLKGMELDIERDKSFVRGDDALFN